MEFMDLSVYERISLRPRVFSCSHLHLWRKPHLCSLFFPKEIGKKESQSHKPLQLQDITSRRHVLQALAHFFKRQGSAKSHTPRQRQGSSLTWRLAFCGSYSCGVSNTLISILPRWQGSAPEDPWSAPAKKKDGKENKTIIEHLGFHCRATCLS